MTLGTFSSPNVFINNNGNLMITGTMSSFTPFGLETSRVPILAPFFADVDTTSNGEPVKYGYGVIDGKPAFGATWDRVDYYASQRAHGCNLNTFQVVITSTNSTKGDVCIEYNYNQIVWETGTASGGNSRGLGGSSAVVGLTIGSSETTIQINGSRVPGSLIDNGTRPLNKIKEGSTVPGRFYFCFTDGATCIPNNGGFTCICPTNLMVDSNGNCVAIPTRTATPTLSATGTPTTSSTPSATDTPTHSPTPSPSSTPTYSPTTTATYTPTSSPTHSSTPSLSDTPTNSPTATYTDTPTFS
eukprot:CAMPEP_0184655144 /NCGR_PEP_ID=MMETSP0308-20130426/12764_1 /TAXON_ID=38269 /ORGANISM="Gloeochaete witrockiana, Strain SAG 46.84" /LENGTH=299 /DNA_ID=CAMNT_0027091439 /DNA_START=506 /DNA_END=1402 /DNA_ORIENTATION=+